MLEEIKVTIKPDYNVCCDCIDFQVLSNTRKDCKKCNKLRRGLLHDFFREKGRTYCIVSYENGVFDNVSMWQVRKES